MVNEAAVDDAMAVARRNPGLQVGLHLTLCDGRATKVSALTDGAGNLPASPAGAGMQYFFFPWLASALRSEIQGQFDRFRKLGFAPSYWDGHTHLHLHPTILKTTVPIAAEAGFRWVRLVREPEAHGVLPWIFGRLSQAAIPPLDQNGIGYADQVLGLTDTGRMDTATLERCLRTLPEGKSELYFHPGAELGEIDYAKLGSVIRKMGIEVADWRGLVSG